MKNFRIDGVTEHAIEQALSKDAPIKRPRQLKRLKREGRVKKVAAAGGRHAFILDDCFVYITNRGMSAVITVLKKWEYKNLMYSQ